MRWWAVRGIIALAIIVSATLLWWQMSSNQNVVRLHGQTYQLAVMRTQAERARGLSGTSHLSADQAMLFVFPNDDKWAIWMKDMNYPIDIVWLDSGKKVIYTVKDAQPSSYPKTFGPDTNSRYVIELPSGTIDHVGIKNNDVAILPSEI